MNNYFILAVGFLEGLAGLWCLIHGQKWLGFMWLSYMFSCFFLFMEGRG